MKSRTLLVSLAVPFTFGLGAVFGPDPAPPGPTIAVVDVERAFRAYGRAKRMLDDLQNEKAQRQAQVQEAVNAANQARGRLDAWDDQTSDEFLRESAKFAGTQAELKARFEAEQERLLRRRAQIQWECLQDIQGKVTELGRRNNVSLILRVHDIPGDIPLQERLVRNDMVAVLYHDPVLDLTDQLIKLLIEPAPVGAAPNDPPK